MDVMKMLEQLRAERDGIDEVIAHLEAIARHRAGGRSASSNNDAASGKRRGRKSMGEEERAVVANRMKDYWAKKREAKSGGATE